MAKIKINISITTTPTELAEGVRSAIIDPLVRDISAFTQAHAPEILIIGQQLIQAAAVRSGLVDDGGDSDDSEDDADAEADDERKDDVVGPDEGEA